jgi:hypothetical protein
MAERIAAHGHMTITCASAMEATQPAAAAAAAAAPPHELQFDLGNLAAFDVHPIDAALMARRGERALLEMAREHTQALVRALFELPVEKSEVGPLALLPAPTTLLPRARHPPAPKPPTRWEAFAKSKGIVKRKKERKVWDEVRGDWAPAFGYKRANDETKAWAIEVRACLVCVASHCVHACMRACGRAGGVPRVFTDSPPAPPGPRWRG